MAVDDILKRIKADAEEAARKIVAEGQTAADAVADEGRATTDAQKKGLTARAEQRAQEERNRITTLARLAARRELLDEKQALVDRVFDEAGGRIVAMEPNEYRKFITGLLLSTVESGDEEVLIGETERRREQTRPDLPGLRVEGVWQRWWSQARERAQADRGRFHPEKRQGGNQLRPVHDSS
jgi:vacuolar-type H+-ATPase subunit E/Vma4